MSSIVAHYINRPPGVYERNTTNTTETSKCREISSVKLCISAQQSLLPIAPIRMIQRKADQDLHKRPRLVLVVAYNLRMAIIW